MPALMYNPMIMQASYTMYSLVDFCNGENENDLRPLIFPINTALVSDDDDADMLINPVRKTVNLIGMLGSLPGGIGTLVDVTQLLPTIQKALNSQSGGDGKSEMTSVDANGRNSSDQLRILGRPPVSSSCAKFAFNHVLASHTQAQLLQRITMPPSDEPVPLEARLPLSSLGSVVSLFDLPLIQPLIAKSSQKTAAKHGPASSTDRATTRMSATSAPVAAAGDRILGVVPPAPRFQGVPPAPRSQDVPPAPRFQGVPPPPRFQAPVPQLNAAAVPTPPNQSSRNRGPLQGGPVIRPPVGRNFAGAPGNWPRARGGGRSAVTNQGGEQKQWVGGWKDDISGNSAGSAYKGQSWDASPLAVESDWSSYSAQPQVKPRPTGQNMASMPHQPAAVPNVRATPPQV